MKETFGHRKLSVSFQCEILRLRADIARTGGPRDSDKEDYVNNGPAMV